MNLDLKEWIKKVTLMFKPSGWANVPSGDASGYTKFTLTTLRYEKVGTLCFVMGTNFTNAISSGWKNIGRLPEGCRPSEMIYATIGNRQNQTMEMQIQDTGNIFINNSSQSVTNLAFTVVFPIVGGVVRKLLNTLKTLTSERRWVTC